MRQVAKLARQAQHPQVDPIQIVETDLHFAHPRQALERLGQSPNWFG